MDQKSWRWRKRSLEKAIVDNGSEDVQSVPVEKEVELENSLKTLNEKLASVLDECSEKDKLVQEYQKLAEEAMADKRKAEEQVQGLKQQLDEVQHQRTAANEKLGLLNSALKECMEQLNLVRRGQEQKVQDAIMESSKDFEKAQKKMEEKLSETSKRLASLTIENCYLSKALIGKEKLVEDLNNSKSQTEAEFEVLLTRLDSIEKENAFLRYEFRALEKELEVRNEEMEYGRRSAEASQKKLLENTKKLKKLEAECQRLRALTRKRMPAPDILANTRSEIELKGRNLIEARREKIKNENTSKNLSVLADRLWDVEEENRILKECLANKEEEILYHQKFKNYAGRGKFDLFVPNLAPDELSFASSENMYSGSWSTALTCEQDHHKVRNPHTENECKMIGASEMSLMDDFVEMEKLAIVAVDAPLQASSGVSDVRHKLSEFSGKELVPMCQDGFGDVKTECDRPYNEPTKWLEDIRNLILEQHNISKRSMDEILEDIKMDLSVPEPSKFLPISGYIAWKSPTLSPRSSPVQAKETNHEFLFCDLNTSISKIIELVRRFDIPCSEVATYQIRVFRWKSSELTIVLQEFIQSCNSLLEGRINFEKFISNLASNLWWIIDNCISYHDHSTIRDEFKKHLGGDGPGTAMELESVQNLMVEIEKIFSIFQVEIGGLRNELKFIKSSDKDLERLKSELEIMKEMKRTTEDQMEDLKLINEDLDTQLTVTKAKLNEVLQKLSSFEVELDNKSHCCAELEGTCVELQLQLESITSNRHLEDKEENQEELLRTGLEMTKASVKLAECEKTILKLGKQLEALGSPKELSVVGKVLSVTTNKYKKLRQRSSLRDQMLSEDNAGANHLESPRTKEVMGMVEAKEPSIFQAGRFNSHSFSDDQGTLEAYCGTQKGMVDEKIGALVIVPGKRRRGGNGFLRKLLLRMKKSGSKNAFLY